ncbi:MAG TPA: hypothetical protein VF865_04650 [Acidobacteriaceae bacterium]
MDQATLVGPDLSAGREIVSVLDAAQIKQITALFVLFPEYSDWRLVLSSPSLDQDNSLKAGRKVHGILHGKFDTPLPPIMILPTKDPFIRELRKIFGKARSVSGMRLGGQTIGNRYTSDAYVYQIQ